MTIDDPFATAEDVKPNIKADNAKKMITGGRYRLSNRDGSHHSGGWQRCTNLVASISDQMALRIWEHEQFIAALRVNPERVIAAIPTEAAGSALMDRQGVVEEFLNTCKDITGGNVGRDFGIARHKAWETGKPKDVIERDHLRLMEVALARHHLRRQEGYRERRVMCEQFNVIGTLDDILWDEKHVVHRIGDLKTQRKFWSYGEVSAQLAIYANADAMWVPTDPIDQRAGHWVDMPPAVAKDIAIVAWLPREQHVAEVLEVDIVAGWKTAQLAYQVVQDRAAAKRTKDPRAWPRQGADPVTATEQWAARFATVTTVAEGRQLVAECRAAGMWNAVTRDEASFAFRRISGE